MKKLQLTVDKDLKSLHDIQYKFKCNSLFLIIWVMICHITSLGKFFFLWLKTLAEVLLSVALHWKC